MKNIYEYSVQQLKNYSKNFLKEIKFLNKPWTLIDEDQEIQRLIFKKNKDLIISKNGEAIIGKWEYLPEANSLLITRGESSLLCNEEFLDDGILIFKKDGTENNFFVLVNENEVPDLDAEKYLNTLRYRTLGISYGYLSDGRLLEIHRNGNNGIIDGNKVTLDHEPAADGVYSTTTGQKKYVVKNSKIAKILHLVEYKTKSNQVVTVEQKYQSVISIGDKVFCLNNPALDGKYRLIAGSKIIVENGKVIKMPWF